MKYKKLFLSSLVLAFLLAASANAQVTGGSIFGGALTNLVTQVTGILGIAHGGGGANTAQGSLNNLNAPTNRGTAVYQVVPCTLSGGDETAFFNAQTAAAANNRGALLYINGCSLANRWGIGATKTANIFGFGQTTHDPYTASFSSPSMNFYFPGIFLSSPAQTAIDCAGCSSLTLDGVNYFVQTTTSDDPYAPTAQIGDTVNGHPGGPDSDKITIANSSIGGGNTIVGAGVDANMNPVAAGGVKTGNITAGGTLYVDGTYADVPLTGGTGTNAIARQIIVSGGVVTSVKLYYQYFMAKPGAGYVINDVLSASNANLGGAGSGFQYTVTRIYGAGYGGGTTANWFPHFINSNFSYETGDAANGNISDARIYLNTFTGGQAFQLLYGCGGNENGLNRYEDESNAVDIGGVNGTGCPGTSFWNDNHFTVQSYGGGWDALFGRGSGYNFENNLLDAAAVTSGTSTSLVIGGYGAISYFNANGNNWNGQGAGRKYCIDLKPGFSMDYINMMDNVCGGNALTADVNWEQVPGHYAALFNDPLGFFVIGGLPVGIGTNIPHATAQMALDLTYNTTALGLPVGTTGTRPATPNTGDIRVNTTTPAVEAYYNGTWNTIGTGSGNGTVTSVTFTGDGTVLSSTPSSAVTTSGTVTATLANAAAGTVLGNNTGSSAAPAYTSVPVLGKSGTLGTIGFGNATSGTITLSPVAGALGSVTLSMPAVTDTLAVLGTAQTYTKSQRVSPVTDSISTATFTPDFSASNNHNITLVHASCPCTLANPTNIVAGQSGQIVVNQSATGSDLINTYGTDYVFTNATAPTLSTGASATDILSYYVIDSTHIRISPVISTPVASTTTNGVISNGTKFTTSGCSVSATTGGATAGKYTSGTTGACTVTITMNGATGLTAPNGWSCSATDLTTAADALQGQTASSATTATISGTTVSGDVVSFFCMGF